MTIEWEWLNKEKWILKMKVNDVDIEFHFSEEAIKYFETEGCTCRFVPVPEIQKIIISGQDDCEIHGFGG